MRDLVVREGMLAMARDAAKLFRELIAGGAEIPYEVREPGNGSPLCQYEPLTGRFVREHAVNLRELDSFGAACAALEAADLAGHYLERMGVGVPHEARARSELAAIAFLCRLWMDSTDFSLDPDRLEAAVDEVELGADVAEDEIEVAVPLRGLQMPVARLELASATIVRADTVDVPAEAQAAEGMGASPWEPTFLAVARVGMGDGGDEETIDTGVRATEAFRRLVTTLRLYKAGGVGLGPYAWTRVGADRWRRISTGAGRPRPGGYRLAEEELSNLVAFSRALSAPSTPFGRQAAGRPGLPVALGRALSRFEAGRERAVAVEALNDNLLALRFVLEGGGPADLGLPMRVAALCAEPERRAEVKAVVDHALALERELWSGEPRADGPAPADTAIELEELARAILRDAACGHLGSDLRSTADEILLADGLATGEGAAEQRGATAEWDVDDAEVDEHLPDVDDEGSGELPAVEPEPNEISEHDIGAGDELELRIVKVPARPGRTKSASPEPEEETVIARARTLETTDSEQPTTSLEAVAQPPLADDADVEGQELPEGNPVLRLIEQTRSEREARAERVAGLFPRPDDCDWNVRELGYDRRRASAS